MKRPLVLTIAVAAALAAGILYRTWPPTGTGGERPEYSEPVTPAWSHTTHLVRPPLAPARSTAISAGNWTSLKTGERIVFTISDTEEFVGVVTEVRSGRVATSFSGNLESNPLFHFTLTTGPKAQFGTVNTPAGVYEIASVGGTTWLYPRDALPRVSDSGESDYVQVQPPLVLAEPPETPVPPPPERRMP